MSMAVCLLWTAMSLHVRTMFGHGISSLNPQRFLNSAKHLNWMSHLFETRRQPNNLPILKNGPFGRHQFQNWSYQTGPNPGLFPDHVNVTAGINQTIMSGAQLILST